MASKYLHRRIKHNLRWEAAKWWLRLHPHTDVVAIAGSVGKTTTKDLTAAILSQAFPTVKSRANFDPIFNLPQTALRIREHTKFVAEMGIDAPGQMSKYLTLVHPKVAVMTELSLEHTDAEHLQSLEVAIQEEWKLIAALPSDGLAILNGDNEHIRELAKTLTTPRLFYGFKPENDLQIVGATQTVVQGRAQLNISLAGKLEGDFHAPLLGRHNGYCMAAAIAVGQHYGMTTEAIQAGLNSAAGPEHRLEIKPVKWGLVIDDTYNSSPKAAIAAIDSLLELSGSSGVLVLGDMLELGEYAVAAHEEVGEYAARQGVRTVLVFGNHTEDIARGFTRANGSGELIKCASHEDLTKWIRTRKPSVTLFKASRGMKLDQVVSALFSAN